MGTSSRCYICDLEINKSVQKSLFEIKTQHSRIPVAELLKRIQKGIETFRPHDGSNICVLCGNCIDKINAYDEAYQLAERVEAELKEMMAHTKGRYQNLTILDTEQMKPIRKAQDFASKPDEVAADPFKLDEMKDEHSLSFDDDTDAGSVEMSEPEEEDFDSDDSFVWPKSAVAKEREGKEEAQKPEMYRCIECPADYRDKYEMQVFNCFQHLSSA